MSCIYCFFTKENQMELKKKCFGNPRYEETLKEYKKLYLSELQKLDYVKNCNCIDNIKDTFKNKRRKIKLFTDYLDSFLCDTKKNINDVSECFDYIISIYDAYIKEDIYSAYNKMSDLIKKRAGWVKSQEATSYSSLLFRARDKKEKYDKNNIYEYFHIPFDKRFKIGNQRFSVSGQPMLYLAGSLQTALVELDKKIDEVNVSIFMPKINNPLIYDIKNNVEDFIHISLINIIEAGSKLKYMDIKGLFSSIFHNILTFPTNNKTKETFIQEYVLPQLLTNILKSYGDIGIGYRSSKEHKWVIYDRYVNQLEYNICFFVTYSKNSNYNEEFLSQFYYSCDTSKIISMKELNNAITELKNYNLLLGNEGYNNSYTGIYFYNIKNHIEAMKKYKGNNYYKSDEGKIERTLIYGLINNIIEGENFTEKLVQSLSKYY